MIKVGLVVSISNFFTNKIAPANNWRRKKIPNCSNLALVISKFLQILGLQPPISKVFLDHQNNFGNKICTISLSQNNYLIFFLSGMWNQLFREGHVIKQMRQRHLVLKSVMILILIIQTLKCCPQPLTETVQTRKNKPPLLLTRENRLFEYKKYTEFHEIFDLSLIIYFARIILFNLEEQRLKRYVKL